MIDPRTKGAVKIAALPVPLLHVRTIEAFDGPLLAEFRSEVGDTFLHYWCDREKDVNRWLVVRTPTQDLTRYLVGVATARDLITKCRDGFVYLVDLDKTDTPLNVFFITVELLPDDYIPTKRSHYDSVALMDGKQQDVFINDQWDYQQVTTDYPRKYLQAYGFNALFGPHGDASNLETIGYKLTQGYVFNTLFRNFRKHIPNDKRASLAGVTVASPGYVRFAVDPSVASDLRRAISGYLAARKEIDAEMSLLSRWANHPEEMAEDAAIRSFVNLSARINLKGDVIMDRVDSIETAIKTLHSYVNKLKYLADNDQEQTAMLVGLQRPRNEPETEPQ